MQFRLRHDPTVTVFNQRNGHFHTDRHGVRQAALLFAQSRMGYARSGTVHTVLIPL